ncbi:DOMON domain-containing protein FRRS1L isoform 3-T4 [Liasis olivaceus]
MAAFAAILSLLHWCSLLWMLLVAAPAASSWAIAADESTGSETRSVRGREMDAKGDRPAEKHQPHDSSYGTFASEFYDTRFLSDDAAARLSILVATMETEAVGMQGYCCHKNTVNLKTQGYPFPTAPPVDPFAKIRVDDCGKTKGCFRYGKPGCNADTCDYFLSYRRIGADIEFELSAEADGWVAVGFSSDKKMGGDDVMACVHDDNGRVRIHHFYNVGQWAKEIQRNPARDEEGIFENNRVTCRFKRPVKVPRDETIVDLHLSWYYLFAWGPAIQVLTLMQWSGTKPSISLRFYNSA